MKNKKIIGLGLATAAILGLAACGTNNNANTNTNAPYGNEIGAGNLVNNENYDLKTYYCAPNSDNINGTGSINDPIPFATAIKKVKAGDTILLLPGVYESAYRYKVGVSYDTSEIADINGAPNYPITVKPAEEGTNVLFDFSEMRFDSNNRGIQVYGSFWHFKNIDVCGAGDNGMYICGNNNTIEGCNFYNNSDTGLQIGRGFNSQATIEQWPSYNLVKNCTSFANYDAPTFGENADGFAAKLTVGYGNVFDGCIAYRNSDDGWDLFAKTDSGCIGTVVLYNCLSFENGYLPYQIERTGIKDGEEYTYKSYNTMNGDGIGFKLGGSTMEGDVILNNCLAFNNKLHGVGDNSNPGVLSLKNVTAVNNCIGINEEDGSVSSTRGIADQVNKSNNFDLARDTKSYNNYYGLVSYINNQKDYKPEGDSYYNTDQFRGSMAYSVLQPSYLGGEKYISFGSYVDASSYHSEAVDIPFSLGEEYTGMSDNSFADLTSFNVTCDSVDDLASLTKYHKELRNADGSVNLGNKVKIVDEKLLTFAEGKPIGHNLSKSSDSEYEHYSIPDFTSSHTRDDVYAASTYAVLEPLCNQDAIFQNFEVPHRIRGCEIAWKSSNTDIIEFLPEEKVSASKSVVGEAKVTCPKEDTKVTLTAEIVCGESKLTKTFEVTVRRRNQSIGKIVNTGSSAIRVNLYGKYLEPVIKVLDSSANSDTAILDPSTYDLTYSYSFAKDRNAKHYSVDGVYTSVAGVYEVTVTAESKLVVDEGKVVTLTYNVYVVDPDAHVDFMPGQTIQLTKDGYSISGNLSNIDGYVYSFASDSPIANLTPEQVVNNSTTSKVEITTDTIVANFKADNNTGKPYYVYYTVVNKNLSNYKKASVYEFATEVKEISTKEEFYEIATTGNVTGYTATSTTIYSLTADLDFADFTWNIQEKTKLKALNALFNGNGHKISNISITGESADKNVNVFYKVSGTLMNLNFENIKIVNTSRDNGKQVGIIGDLQGGYVHNIKMTNVSSTGKEAVGALIGQVSGRSNYVSNCQLINDDNQVINAYNKYAAGIIGNAQMNSDQNTFSLEVTDCAVIANIGDGFDAAGNNGGIIGRIKNDNVVYSTVVKNCFYKGTITSKGQYNGGIVGDFDNGSGYAEIGNCISLAIFVYDGMLLDAFNKPDLQDQTYAHKNSNPIVGRAVAGLEPNYNTYQNIGTWTEYYYANIKSSSIVFDYESWTLDEDSASELGFDLENTWNVNVSKETLTLK